MNVPACAPGTTCLFLQEHGATAALIAAAVSLIGLAVKCVHDWISRRDSQTFQADERQLRMNFERDQRLAREEFERAQQAREQAFQSELKSAEVRIQVHMEKFISEKKYQDERRDKRIQAARLAHVVLGKTYDDLAGLVARSSGYDEFSMITETAKFLDQFAKFKESVGRDAVDLPGPFREEAREILELFTKILLTLSPDQERRQHEQVFLDSLVRELHTLTQRFEQRFTRFQTDPETCPPELDLVSKHGRDLVSLSPSPSALEGVAPR